MGGGGFAISQLVLEAWGMHTLHSKSACLKLQLLIRLRPQPSWRTCNVLAAAVKPATNGPLGRQPAEPAHYLASPA